jgi:hypothetical protein
MEPGSPRTGNPPEPSHEQSLQSLPGRGCLCRTATEAPIRRAFVCTFGAWFVALPGRSSTWTQSTWTQYLLS